MRTENLDLIQPDWRAGWYHAHGTRFHVIEAGRSDAPLLVLLHGFPEFWWAWRNQITPFADAGYHVLVPDLQGYGDSSGSQQISAYTLDRLADGILGLVDALGRDRFQLIGHDWGAVISCYIAAKHPERVERLVAISGPHPGAWADQIIKSPGQALRSAYVAFFQLPWLPEAILSAFRFARLKAALRRSARPGTFDVPALKQYARAWARPGAMSRMLNYYRALRLSTGLMPPPIAQPALLIWGNKDRFLGRALIEATLARCERGALMVIDGGTHWVHLENSAEITSEVIRFLARA